MTHPLIVVDGDGFKRGADPRHLTADQLEAAGALPKPVLSAIREKCLDCCCDQRSEVAACTSVSCALWPFRFGTNPYRAAREMTDEQRAAAAERLAKAREARAAVQ